MGKRAATKARVWYDDHAGQWRASHPDTEDPYLAADWPDAMEWVWMAVQWHHIVYGEE